MCPCELEKKMVSLNLSGDWLICFHIIEKVNIYLIKQKNNEGEEDLELDAEMGGITQYFNKHTSLRQMQLFIEIQLSKRNTNTSIV